MQSGAQASGDSPSSRPTDFRVTHGGPTDADVPNHKRKHHKWRTQDHHRRHAGPIQAEFAAPNLTSDRATGLGEWTDAEIARAIRSGVDRKGRELIVMPAEQFRHLSDQELSAVIGYLRTLQPVANEVEPFSGNAFAKALLGIGLLAARNPPGISKAARTGIIRIKAR